MRIEKITVQNFRLLKNFSLNLKNKFSLIVGKNNCGKTSILTVLEKILNRKRPLVWEDVNLNRRQDIFNEVKKSINMPDNELREILGIKLQILITYSKDDSYENIQTFMMDLNPLNNYILLDFSWSIPISEVKKLNDSYSDCLNDFIRFEAFMRKNAKNIFNLQICSLGYDPINKQPTNEKSEPLDMTDVSKVIQIKGISASREVSNKENNHSLSKQSNQYYKLNSNDEIDNQANGILEEAVNKADETLTIAYSGDGQTKGIFNPIFDRVKKFGGTDATTELSIRSSLSELELLNNNTTLYYKHDDSLLPESYNGLGYLNLYGMIFEIETLMASIKNNPADINLIYIEEPESHTHPQLQYIFIRNIKRLLMEEHLNELKQVDNRKSIQSLITTHSSHIVSDCDFDDLIYFKRENGQIISKSFNSLRDEYADDMQGYKFVKQYLTLNRSELFFAEKAICIEGDTERILMPLMMKKVDDGCLLETSKLPLLSQNISIIEAGAFSHVFKRLFDFLGIKVLIITDIDPAKKNIESRFVSCDATEATSTTNASIKDFFEISGDNNFSIITDKTFEEKINANGNIRIAYQIQELEEYQPASFEDSFISLNKEFIIDKKEGLIKYEALKAFKDVEVDDFYTFSRTKVNKKSAFASSLLYLEDEKRTWNVPKYISEGLIWLKEQ